ncbi:DoxX family protein [Streptomyces griseosporeus]|uniref:DoxX family protein n=1 Tax=Streptomyces griseosporeus TaxID=1910 RepID=UPI0036FE4C6D
MSPSRPPTSAGRAAAACGLVLFYLGALVFHLRARVLSNLAFPGFYFATAVASLALAVSC